MKDGNNQRSMEITSTNEFLTVSWQDISSPQSVDQGFAGQYYSVTSFIICFHGKVSCDVKIFLPVVVITLPVARARSVQLRHLS